MKTIVLKSNNTSIYRADDSITIDTSGDRIKWLDSDGGVIQIIADIATSDLTVHSNVTEVRSDVEYLKGTSVKIEDWEGHKYSYDGTNWVEL